MQIFLLTSPFDEDAKTGDGDYANALDVTPSIPKSVVVSGKSASDEFLPEFSSASINGRPSAIDTKVGLSLDFDTLSLLDESSQSIDELDFALSQDALEDEQEENTWADLTQDEIDSFVAETKTICESEYLSRHGARTHWLKEKNQDYQYLHEPCLADIESIPRGTNPSVACLEAGRTMAGVLVAGYRLKDHLDFNFLNSLRTKCEYRVTPYTPQVIVDDQGKILSLYLASRVTPGKGIQKIELTQSSITYFSMLIKISSKELEFTENLQKAFNEDNFEQCKTLLSHSVVEVKATSPAKIKGQVTNVLQQRKKAMSRHQAVISECQSLIDLMSGDVPIKSRDAEKTLKKVIGHNAAYLNVYTLIDNKRFATSPHGVMDEKLFASADDSFSIPQKAEKLRHYSTNFEDEKFHDVCRIAENDPDRLKSINEIIQTIVSKRGTEKAVIDVHHRPPVTGALFFPSDIAKFHAHGIAVHITVHEYKQNDTRRHLQAYTQALIQSADAVKFFNEKEANNALHASRTGELSNEYYCLDKYQTLVKIEEDMLGEDGDKDTINEARKNIYEEIEQKRMAKKFHHAKEYFQNLSPEAQALHFKKLSDNHYALRQYQALDGKLSVSPAAMLQATETLPKPEEILSKPANIICFGTIRPGKGFLLAVEMANKIKERNDEGNFADIMDAPILYCAGRVEDSELMLALMNTRYHPEVVQAYLAHTPLPVDYLTFNAYFKQMIAALDDIDGAIQNAYLSLAVDLSSGELMTLKGNCKYVLRLDDMGMRNNGSGIINVLSTGIVFAKWGAVTDKEFYSIGTATDLFSVAKAVDIGQQKYGRFFRDKHADRMLKKAEDARDVDALLDNIVEREKDQSTYKDNITVSQNFQCVRAAQRLLQRFFPSYVSATLRASYEMAERALPVSKPKGLRGMFYKTHRAAAASMPSDASLGSSLTISGGKK